MRRRRGKEDFRVRSVDSPAEKKNKGQVRKEIRKVLDGGGMIIIMLIKEEQRVFSTVMQVGIKMSTQKHQGTCAPRRMESRLLSLQLNQTNMHANILYMQEHTCRGLSGSISCPALHLDHVARLHICSLALNSRYSCKYLMGCDVLSNMPHLRTLFSTLLFFVVAVAVLNCSYTLSHTETDLNEFCLAKVWCIRY